MTVSRRSDGERGSGRPRDRAAPDGPAGRAPRRETAGMQAARRAARQVMALTGHEPENVVSVDRNEDGWHVGVEVLELHRIPDTTDIMAVYEVTLDGRGELVGCRRGPRYHRGRADGQE
jgi:hypothetical protein